jgi:maltose alpha-D-glucosyltransferase/alpha-amylase
MEPLKATVIAYASPLASGADGVLLAEVTAELADHTETYLLPLGIGWDDDVTGTLPQLLALARVRRGRQLGYLTDGFGLDRFARAVLVRLRNRTTLTLAADHQAGEVVFRPTARMLALDLADDADIRRLSAEQSNSSMVIGDAIVIKIVRHVVGGIHPEGEMTRYLTERGFANIAPFYADVVRVDTSGNPATLMLVQGFIRNQGDGWRWTLEFLERTVEELAVTGGSQDEHDDTFATYASFAASVGRRLAEMHAALSVATDDTAFAPYRAAESDIVEWADTAIVQLEGAFTQLRRFKEWPDEASADSAKELLAHEPALKAAMRRLASAGPGALVTRIHGDFHLGQVLVAQGDAFLIDFEGEPARSMAQRRAKSCPLKDVAGLLRSFDYATAAAAPGRVAASAQTHARRAALLQLFREDACSTFLRAYNDVLDQAEPRWVRQDCQSDLLDLFLIEKAAYEIRYEAANRPTWLPIPLRGLSRIAARVLVLEEVHR